MSSGDPGGGRPHAHAADKKPPDPGPTGQPATEKKGVEGKLVSEQYLLDECVPETPLEQWDIPCEDEWEVHPEVRDAEVDGEGDRRSTSRETTSGASKGKEGCATGESSPDEADTNPEEVHPKDIFEALIAEVKEVATGPPRETWKQSTLELFERVHATLKIKTELVPKEKQRYPKMKEDEKGLLYQLFEEACVTGSKTYKEWVQLETEVIQELYNTTWAFKNIIRSKMSKVKWERLPALNQWATKRTQGQADQGNQGRSQSAGFKYERVMFKPGVYSKEEVDRLRSICESPAAVQAGRRLRKPTEEEWKIMTGLVHGTIVCRQLPDFIKSVMGAQERLRLYKTVQKQVEGELVLKLRSGMAVKTSRQSTKTR